MNIPSGISMFAGSPSNMARHTPRPVPTVNPMSAGAGGGARPRMGGPSPGSAPAPPGQKREIVNAHVVKIYKKVTSRGLES